MSQQVNSGDGNALLGQAALDQKLSQLKLHDLSAASVSVFVAEVSTSNKNKRCKKAKELSCHIDLQNKLKGYVLSCIESKAHISQLNEINTNQDNRFFYVEKDATDFEQVISAIHPSGATLGVVSGLDELSAYNCYVIRLTFGSPVVNLYAFHYFGSAWSVKNVSTIFLKFNAVAGLEEKPIFKIEPYIDFISIEDDLFIANIAKFESSMHFQGRLLERKSEVVAELEAGSVLAVGGSARLSNSIGTDKHFMRQLASVQAKGYYKDAAWMGKLRQEIQAAGNWLIEFNAAGKLVIKEDKAYIKELLTVLQNKRVQTVVDKHICDVDGELTELIPRASN